MVGRGGGNPRIRTGEEGRSSNDESPENSGLEDEHSGQEFLTLCLRKKEGGSFTRERGELKKQ